MAGVNDEGGYGRFGTYSRVELERYFHLDDEDKRLTLLVGRDHIHGDSDQPLRRRPQMCCDHLDGLGSTLGTVLV
jgi:hypothetical protein